MSTYRDRKLNRKSHQLETYLEDMPNYCTVFVSSISELNAETQFLYVFDIHNFMEYVSGTTQSDITDIKGFPISTFNEISKETIEDWLYSTVDGFASRAYSIRRLAALRAFYQFLISRGYCKTSPCDDIVIAHTQPKTSAVSLEKEQMKKFLRDVSENNSFLYNGPEGRFIAPINNMYRVIRERQVSRNCAFLSVIIFCGLTVSETASLNVEDIDFVNNTISFERRDGSSGSVTFDDTVKHYLSSYIFAPQYPAELVKRKITPSFYNVLPFCRKHMLESEAPIKAQYEFGNQTAEFAEFISDITHMLRTRGRESFYPLPTEKALFLSATGHRLSVRSMQDIISELTKTYLPQMKNLNSQCFRSSLRKTELESGTSVEKTAANFGIKRKYAAALKKSCK